MNRFLEIFLGVFTVLSLFWPLWVAAGLLLLGRLAFKLYKRARLWHSGIAELDQLDGVDFEHYLALLFGKLGYTVQRTPPQGDYGADLILQKARIQTMAKPFRPRCRIIA